MENVASTKKVSARSVTSTCVRIHETAANPIRIVHQDIHVDDPKDAIEANRVAGHLDHHTFAVARRRGLALAPHADALPAERVTHHEALKEEADPHLEGAKAKEKADTKEKAKVKEKVRENPCVETFSPGIAPMVTIVSFLTNLGAILPMGGIENILPGKAGRQHHISVLIVHGTVTVAQVMIGIENTTRVENGKVPPADRRGRVQENGKATRIGVHLPDDPQLKLQDERLRGNIQRKPHENLSHDHTPVVPTVPDLRDDHPATTDALNPITSTKAKTDSMVARKAVIVGDMDTWLYDSHHTSCRT